MLLSRRRDSEVSKMTVENFQTIVKPNKSEVSQYLSPLEIQLCRSLSCTDNAGMSLTTDLQYRIFQSFTQFALAVIVVKVKFLTGVRQQRRHHAAQCYRQETSSQKMQQDDTAETFRQNYRRSGKF